MLFPAPMSDLWKCRRYLDIPLTDNQQTGSVAFLLLSVAILLSSLLFPGNRDHGMAPSGDERSGSVVVALDGDPRAGGVYFLPPGTTRRAFGNRIGIPGDAWRDGSYPDRALMTGTAVLWGGCDPGAAPRFQSLDAARRLALGLPIDVNRSTGEELALVPGIGPRTAEKILQFRERKRKFSSLEDLKRIRGIKEKRLEKLRPYLAVIPEESF